VEALAGISGTATLSKDIVAAVTPKLTGVQPQELNASIRTLYSLYQVRGLSDLSADDFARDLADAMNSLGIPTLALTDAEREPFIKKMSALLNVESLKFIAKAVSLQRDHEHIFHDVKILTDLRPVFHEPDQEPQEMIVEYTLKIVFHDGNRHRELYMALDADDVSRFRAVIDRAEKKAASLTSLLESKGITRLRMS